MNRVNRLREAEFLKNIYPDLNFMKGTILRLDIEGGFDNYTSRFGNPMKETTLILGDDDNNVLLFFNPSEKPVKKSMIEGVSVLTCYKYSNDMIIHKHVQPIALPKRLEPYVLDFAAFAGQQSCTVENVGNLMADMTITPMSVQFMDTHYKRGDMIRLKNVTEHPFWKKEYRMDLSIKKFQMCKSCGKRALRGCCDNYSSTNRKPITMIVGWCE